MNKSEKKIAFAAERFAMRWADEGYEKGYCLLFWIVLYRERTCLDSNQQIMLLKQENKIVTYFFIFTKPLIK